ncbi:hypothetical protein PTKIN_Ptkin06aG0064600 [Pterospermum kingtungense]
MSYQPLSELAIGKLIGDIRVRILLKWFGINFKKNQMITFDLLLMDEKGTVLQASMTKTHSDSFDSNIKEGSIYVISNFKVTRPKPSFNVISAPYMITISRETLFVQIELNDLIIPAYHFEFAEFDTLQSRAKNNYILTDVIGLITSISKLSKVYVSNNPKQVARRIVQLKNLRGEMMTATLWGDFALIVDDQLIGQGTNRILILAAATVNEFCGKNSLSTCSASKVYIDLDLPIVADMKASYKLSMIVEDESSTASFIAFGDVGEKLTGTPVSRLALIGDLDQYILPEPIKKKLIGQKTLYAVNSITKDTDFEEITF